jgi:protein required for attachment to host cells
MEISNAISSEKSKSKSQLNLVIDNNTENISMSDLELLANKNKVNKPELLVSDIISEKKLESHRKTSSKSKSKSKTKKERHYTTNTTDSLDTTAYQKDKLRKINKENKNEKIRFQKTNCYMIFLN